MRIAFNKCVRPLRSVVRRGLLVACVALVTSCRAETPRICRSSPPEDSENYARWVKMVEDANCKNLRVINNEQELNAMQADGKV